MHIVRCLVLHGITLAMGIATASSVCAEDRKIPLGNLSAYLDDLETAKADFTQVNSDQTLSTGRLSIMRPGRMRFDYAPPDDTLVIAGGGQLAVFDGKSNVSRPEQYPLSQTPLSILLEREIDLSDGDMVIDHRADGPRTIVSLRDPRRPHQGHLDLVFTGAPVELRQWVVVDSAGTRTTTILGDLEERSSVPSRLFSIPAEIMSRER